MDDLEHIVNDLRRSNKQSIGLAIFLLIIAAVLLVIPAEEPKDALIKYVIMGKFFVLGMGFILAGLLLDPQRNPLVTALREKPDDIVWVYTQKIFHSGADTSRPPYRDGRNRTDSQRQTPRSPGDPRRPSADASAYRGS